MNARDDGAAPQRLNADFTPKIEAASMSANLSSARLHYATIAMIELAMKFDHGEVLCVRDISDRHGIPLPFLTQILNQLKSHGLVHSTRGATGGYRLSRSPDQITLADIAAVWLTASEFTASSKDSDVSRLSSSIWSDAQQATQRYLEGMRLDSVVEQFSAANMFHI
jgi:Rrf2 family protein